MGYIAVYNTYDGKIVRNIQEYTRGIELEAGEGEALYMGDALGYSHIIGGIPVLIPEIIPLPQLKGSKISMITSAFEYSLVSRQTSYTTTGLTPNITVNAASRDLDNAKELRDKMIEETIANLPFKCFDNTYVLLTLADVKQLITEMRNYGFWLYQHKWELLAAVEAATTAEELEAIVW
jgi:hypothetical protein